MQETSEATATQTPLAPLTEEVAEQPSTETAAPEPSPEGPEAPGPAPDKEVTEAPKPQFIIHGEEVADEYAVLDHEKIRPHLNRQLDREREALQGQYTQAVNETKDNLEAIHENRLYANYIGNLVQKLRDEDLPGAEAIADKFKDALEKKERYETMLGMAGEQRVNKQVLDMFKATLGRREQDEFEDWKVAHRNAEWREIVEKRDELRGTTSKKPLQDENTALKAENEGLKERIRTGKGPDLIPKGGARGNDDELLLNPNTPIEIVNEILARQAGS